jgi:hypothetical protein
MIEARGVNGRVSFDGRAVTINRKGFMARATIGKGTKTIPIHQITGVQWKDPGMVRGFIQFTVPGGVEQRSRFGRQTIDATKDENAVVFGVRHKAEFEALRDAVQEAISVGDLRSAPQAPSVADELAKLAELRVTGVISPDEFEAEKARLLQR